MNHPHLCIGEQLHLYLHTAGAKLKLPEHMFQHNAFILKVSNFHVLLLLLHDEVVVAVVSYDVVVVYVVDTIVFVDNTVVVVVDAAVAGATADDAGYCRYWCNPFVYDSQVCICLDLIQRTCPETHPLSACH